MGHRHLVQDEQHAAAEAVAGGQGGHLDPQALLACSRGPDIAS